MISYTGMHVFGMCIIIDRRVRYRQTDRQNRTTELSIQVSVVLLLTGWMDGWIGIGYMYLCMMAEMG